MHKLHFSAGTCGSSSKETPGSFPAWSLLRQREGSRTLFSCRQLNSVREPSRGRSNDQAGNDPGVLMRSVRSRNRERTVRIAREAVRAVRASGRLQNPAFYA